MHHNQFRDRDTGSMTGDRPLHSRPPLEAEQRLWCAVLTRAIEDLNPSDTDDDLWPGADLQAIRWLRSGDTGLGSARWICELLDYNHAELLLKLKIGKPGALP